MSGAGIERILDFYRGLGAPGYGPDARLKPFWHRENFSHFLRGEDGLVRPVTVEFWPSLSCNCRCALCPYRRNGARADADSPAGAARPLDFFANLETAHRVAEECRRLGVLSVLITGGGEPFVNPEVDRVAAAFASQGLAVGVYSNGTVTPRDDAIAAVCRLRPRFVRLSVNSGSAAEHQREYGFAGGWESLARNARLWARLLPPKTPLAFSWVLTGHEGRATYAGAAAFLLELHRETKRTVSGHFRPKLVYYDENGTVHRASGAVYRRIGRLLEEVVAPAVAGEAGVAVEVNRYAIESCAAGAGPQTSFATGWVTSFTHRGEGYITSELNGSTWPDTCWGSLARRADGSWPSFEGLWLGGERQRLARLYADEPRLPVYHKLTGVTSVLRAIRELSPEPFSPAQVEAFWRAFDARRFERPAHWDFI